MKVYGRSAVSEFLEDRIVYRNLEACDTRLPRLEEIRRQLSLPVGQIPRKQDAGYARVIVRLLQIARAIDLPECPIQRLIYLGDTHMSDGTAFTNLCTVGGWPGRAFIASENNTLPALQKQAAGADQELYQANRWSLLEEFAAGLRSFPVDQHTAVVIDLDKTAIGARGRNASVIDQARVSAVYDTVAGLLGNRFDQNAFRSAYDQLNQPEFHPFTADNQDYLAYICLILVAGLYHLDEIVQEVRGGQLQSFENFIQSVDIRRHELPDGLRSIHHEIYANVLAGDPTPFKPFRRREYRVTIGRMGFLGDDAPLETILRNEIVITQEVRAAALTWQKQGALTFGLSDKPDEASLPTSDLLQEGCQPIHRTETHMVGE